jgi:hypothetical protein
MVENQDEWIIDFRGYFPEMIKDSFSGEYFTDFVSGTRSIIFRGSEEEMNEYVAKMTGDDSRLKLIGIMNKLDTLIELIQEIDRNGELIDQVKISDLFEGKSFKMKKEIALLLIPEKERNQWSHTIQKDPKRTYIRRPDFVAFIEKHQKEKE